MLKKVFLFGFMLLSLLLSAQQVNVFLGSYNRDTTKAGLYVYSLNMQTGVLTKVSDLAGILNPTYLALSQDGTKLYACTYAQTPNDGRVSAFSFDKKTKKLSFINSQPSGGENPAYVALHKSGKWLVNANYSGGSVGAHPILEDGSIGSNGQVITYQDSSVLRDRQTSSHIHSSVFNPVTDYLYLPDLGADKIRNYKFDANSSQPLTTPAHGDTKSTLASGPRHFTVNKAGNYAYCIEELTGTITVYKAETGELLPIQRITTHPDTIISGFASADIHISPDGRFLYASNRGKENNIAIYSIRKNGMLTMRGIQSTYGEHPRNFAIDPSGKYLIAANQNSNNVVVFRRNFKTGLLTKVSEVKDLVRISCVKFVAE